MTNQTAHQAATPATPATPAALPRFITVNEVAEAIGCSRQSIYNAIERGALPAPVRFGRNLVRFVESEVLEAIDALREGGAS